MNCISVNNLYFRYSENSPYAVDNVSFDIEKGSYTSIVGFNGSGKSTIARIISGLENPSEGTVTVQDKLTIGMVFQSPKNQIVSGIVSRDTAFGPQNLKLSKSEIELRTIESLNIVDMLHKAQSSSSALSLGQTQKIALSGIIAIRPDILILDEAVSMLDPKSRSDIYEFVNYWHSQGNTIIQITHEMEVLKQSQKVIGIEKGKVFFDGTKEEFLKKSDLIEKLCGETLPETPKNLLLEKQNKQVSLRVENLAFTYDKSLKKGVESEPDIKNVSFELYKGTLTAFTGSSGAGKSTIFELCSGLLKADDGSKILAVSKPVIAQQNASAALFEAFAADDVAFGPINQGKHGKELKALVRQSMDMAYLPYDAFGDRHTFGLSGGEQRRLSIAGILALNADIYIFDEPTAGLDAKARLEIMKLLQNLALEGKTVVFSTHKRDEAGFAQREIQIENGRLVLDTCKSEASPAENIPELKELEISSSEGLLASLRTMNAGVSLNNQKKKKPIQVIPSFLRMILFLVLFCGSLATRNLIPCLAWLLASVVYSMICGYSLKQLLKSFFKILPFLLFFSIFQMIFHPALPEETHFTNWKWFMVTPSKLIFCLVSMLRTISAIACLCGNFVSTPEYELIDGLKILLKPLELIKIPVRYFILILEVIFRFIPLLIEEASAIIKTQIIRGGLGCAKSKIGKIKAFLPLIVPMIIQTIKRSEALADAITMRCFK